jgi:hypothetical protein
VHLRSKTKEQHVDLLTHFQDGLKSAQTDRKEVLFQGDNSFQIQYPKCVNIEDTCGISDVSAFGRGPRIQLSKLSDPHACSAVPGSCSREVLAGILRQIVGLYCADRLKTPGCTYPSQFLPHYYPTLNSCLEIDYRII